jgi:hypothetical protein
MQNKADSFYKQLIQNVLFANYPNDQLYINIKRWDFNTPDGRIKQLADIDVTIDIEIRNTNEKIHWNISEKFRTADYNDMFIELYSKYPNINGWGINTQADWIYYHTPENLYVVNAKDIKKISEDMKNNTMPSINHLVEEMQERGSNLNQSYYKNSAIDFIKTPTYVQGKKAWDGLGVCIPWDLLAEWDVFYKKYNKNFINDL